MAKFSIETIFSAVDHMSPQMKSMQKQAKQLKGQFADSFKGLATEAKVGAAAIGIATAAGAGALKIMSDFADKGDEIAKTSRVLGVSTDALQKLRYAAQMSGVGTEELDGALKKLNANLGDLKNGTGSLYSSLSKTNPALAKQLRNAKDTETAFYLVVDAINSETDAQKKAALSQDFFSKSGQDLIKLIGSGSAGIKELGKEAEKYGAIISEDATKKSEEFGDSLTRAKTAIQGALIPALSAAITAVQPLLQQFADWVAKNKDLIAQDIVGFMKGVASAGKAIAAAWNSGLIPAVLAGVTAFNMIIAALKLFQTVQIAATVAQTAFDVALDASGIGIITTAIAALIAGIVLLAMNWDKVTAAVKVFAGYVKTGLLIALKGALGMLDMIAAPIREIINLIAQVTGSKYRAGKLSDMVTVPSTPMSPNAGVISSNSTVTKNNNSNVSIDFKNMPSWAQMTKTGSAPGLSLSTGTYGAVR